MAAWTDERVEILMGRLLQSGVTASALAVLAGGLWYLFGHAMDPVAYGAFHGGPRRLTSIRGILGAMRHPDSRTVIQFGLLLLIATPVARVAFSVLAFARQHDRTYVVITLLVLAILIFSLAGGIRA